MKNKITTSFLRKENVFFILYDWYDNFLCYYDNSDEMINAMHSYGLKTDLSQYAYKFSHSKYDYIQIQKLPILCKLYYFIDDELEKISI